MTTGRAAATVALCLVLAACSSGAGTTTSAAPTPSAAPASVPVASPRPTPTADPLAPVRHSMDDLRASRLIASIEVGGQPDWQVFGGGAFWVATGGANSVVRVDATTNEVVASVPESGPCFGMAAGFGSIWAPSCGSPNVFRVDAVTNAVTVIPVGPLPFDGEGQIVATDKAIYLPNADGIVRIDPKTNKTTSVAIEDGPIAALVWAGGSLWGTAPLTDLVLQLDPAGKVLRTISVVPNPRFAAAGEGGVWVLGQDTGEVSRIDPATGTVVATIPVEVPGDGGCVAAGEGGVWITMPGRPFNRIDPVTNTVTEQYEGDGGDCIGVGGGSIWLSNHQFGTVWRIRP